MCSVVPAGAELRHVELFGGSTAARPLSPARRTERPIWAGNAAATGWWRPRQRGSATPRKLARQTCDLCPSYSPQILPYPGSPGTASGEPRQVCSISDKFIPPAHHSPSCALAMLRGHAHAPSPRKQSCQTHTPPPEEATTPLSFRSTPSGAAPRRRSPLQPRIFGFLSWSAASALLSIATSPSKEPPLPSSLEPSAPEISTWAIRPPGMPDGP
mmetsp:Transcript_8636/g.25659  ORF Transcript_8636/g.25659 Transcript_8636/m.25659 type:complete len:214 (+) Transcript_8636:455-1096(+)